MRDDAITIAKGFGIMLMVLGHAYGSYISTWVNMFHMPLFFFFAGYCMNDKYLTCFKSFAARRVKGLYIPFVKWNLIFLCLHNVFVHFGVYDLELYSGFDYAIKAKRFVTQMNDCEQLLGGLWFLKALFVSSFVGYACIRFIPCWYREAVLLALAILASSLDLSIPYFCIGKTEVLASLFFVLGYDYKRLGLQIESYWAAIIPIAITIVTLGAMFWPASATNYSNWTTIPFVLTALFGILAVYSISRLITTKVNQDSPLYRAIMGIGENTLAILIWHFSTFKLVSLFLILIYRQPFSVLSQFPTIHYLASQGWFILYLIAGVSIPVLLAKVNFLRK